MEALRQGGCVLQFANHPCAAVSSICMTFYVYLHAELERELAALETELETDQTHMDGCSNLAHTTYL
jgi:hypothetical protein